MNLDLGVDDWELLDTSLDDVLDTSSFQQFFYDGVPSGDDTGSNSAMPLPAPHRESLGPRFSSPFQLDPQHVAVSRVSQHCTFETGLPRPTLSQRAGPTRISELHSGGKPLPKLKSQRPDSIQSVLDQPCTQTFLGYSMDQFALGATSINPKRPRIAKSAPQPKEVNISRIKQASDSSLFITSGFVGTDMPYLYKSFDVSDGFATQFTANRAC